MASLEEMVRHLQESMKMMQQDAVRQAEFARQQATLVKEQAETIARLEQQTGASASHQAPPSPGVPNVGETANVQTDTELPTGPPPPPTLPQIQPQLSKTPILICLYTDLKLTNQLLPK